MITPQKIINDIEVHYGIAPGSILERTRGTNVAKARIIAMALSRQLTGFSYPELGDIFHRDYSTIIKVIDKSNRYQTEINYFIKKYKPTWIQRLLGRI